MNLSLSDEQVFLREAARGALSRFKTLEAAREALDGEEGALPDLWPTACEAGWPGLLIDEAHGGAGLDAFDAMLVIGECGRVLAGVPLLGHLPATAILGESPSADEFMAALASGERRAAYLPAQPPSDAEGRWSTDPHSGLGRAPLPSAGAPGDDGRVSVTGSFAFVPDAPGADVLVGACEQDGTRDRRRDPRGRTRRAGRAGAPLRRHPLARSRLARGRPRGCARCRQRHGTWW